MYLQKLLMLVRFGKNKKNSEPELYEQFMETHNCLINHEGSAGSMEVAGLVDCFMNSIENRKLHYTHYIALGMVTQKHIMR